ncbi:DUF2330 domain-containing protein, partial [Streptomyces sp. NPDC005899]|uniref:DUF2330 domain-containing protein n=1 Tax=Streptomyces sp. NPDC005899 TaxID=3155716 RepID=UPI00340D942C
FGPGAGFGPRGRPAGAGPPARGARRGAPVGVVDRRRLGPFDVARLTAADPEALRSWLDANGFELPGRLADALRPYVEREWEYVAVRLAPRERGAVLQGALDPLRLRFASERPVYPMRLSRLARTAQSLGLYVLAGHRMETSGRIGGREPEVRFAGRLEPGAADGAVGRLVGGGPAFLTAIDQDFPEPARIDGDHELREARADTPYRTVRHREALLTAGGIPVWLLTVLAAALSIAGALVWLGRRRRSRRA